MKKNIRKLLGKKQSKGKPGGTNTTSITTPPYANPKKQRKLTISDLLKPNATFQETAASRRQDLLIHKLRLCQIVFDWNDNSAKEERAKDAKRCELLELVDYFGKTKNIFTEPVLVEIIRLLSVNLFRTLPPRMYRLDWGEGEEDPEFSAAWPHLQIVYEFFLRCIVSSDADAKILSKYITQPFVLKILELFDSANYRERDYLKTILHRIYAKLMLLRAFIRKSIANVFFVFIWETEKHNGIAELLEILGSVINGFALPIKEEHRNFLQRALIPLHKVQPLGIFHQQLSYCVTQFVDKDPMLAVSVINGLLKFWPVVDSSKEVMFLNELEELLELTQPEEFKIVLVPLFKVLSRAIGSLHFQIAERALIFWDNEYISGLIADHRVEILTLIYPTLYNNSQRHWNATVNSLTVKVIDIFTELDAPLVEQCSQAYLNSLKEKAVADKIRKDTWDGLLENSDKLKTEK